jgi:hypothetical protein
MWGTRVRAVGGVRATDRLPYLHATSLQNFGFKFNSYMD